MKLNSLSSWILSYAFLFRLMMLIEFTTAPGMAAPLMSSTVPATRPTPRGLLTEFSGLSWLRGASGVRAC